MDQNGLLRSDLMGGVQHVPSGQHLNRKRCTLIKTYEIGKGNRLCGGREAVFGVGLAAHGCHPHPGTQAADASSHLFDYSRCLEPWSVRKLGCYGVLAPPEESIGEIDSRSSNFD